MKKSLYTFIFAFVMLVACNGRKTADTVDTTGNNPIEVSDSIEQGITSEDITIYGITDREGEQSADLFRGYDDSLLDSLLADGQTGFRSAFNVFLAVNDSRTVLFDAGIGSQGGGVMLEKLHGLGIEPEKVDDICLTHLHFDHIGGLLNDGLAVFPRATIHLSQPEFEAYAGDERWQQVLKAYEGRVETFADNAVLFDGMVQTLPAYGHTPGHTVYRVDNCLMVGDLLHAQDLQLQHPNFCARYDANPDKAVEVRKNIYNYISAKGLVLCGAHCYDHFIKL